MEGLPNLRRSLQAGSFGLLAMLAASLPPLRLIERADLGLFDAWSRSGATATASGIVIVDADAAALGRVAELAAHANARILVTTLPEPPSAALAAMTIGPTDVPAGSSHLRRTEWRHGGHLWFETDLDGAVRHDRPAIDDTPPTPSLAVYVARHLAAAASDAPGASRASFGAETDGRRWLRFSRQPFEEIGASDLDENRELLRHRIVIAGPATAIHETPVGRLSTPQLVGQLIAGYRDDRRIDSGVVATIAPWLVAATLLLLAAIRIPAKRRNVCLAGAAAAVALLAWAGASFALGNVWLPVAGPVAWLLLSAAALAAGQPAAVRVTRQDTDLVAARRAAAAGQLADAWSHYRLVSPASGLLPELYDLACALDTGGYEDEAIDLFHRVAQIDGRFRDVAKRLARGGGNVEAHVPDANRIPTEMGRYQLLEPIARGAMGYVYLGRDPKINRVVALKVVDLAAEFDVADLEAASKNFLREAEIAGRLSHPNIVTIFDVGETTGLAYIAMEYLKGRHLSEFAAPDRLLPVRTVLELLGRTADALDYAHAQNVIHRDIKPANIMYDSISDGLKITDFGIARLVDVSRTRTGIVLGTPAFMSPEQLEGKNVNGHTDLFALGVSLYQLLTGQLPFRGASMTKLMFVIANEPHESVTTIRPDLPMWLNPIVDRALAKDPAERFQTGAEMAAALRHGAAQLA
jgi:eukaryotic-like serine/threonine-protein kinase